METPADIFSRTVALIGEDNMERLRRTKVIVFGVGGVGSWCAEALVRSGGGTVTLVDPDEVCYSNINRQLPATVATVGRAKAEVLRERFLTINPQAQIDAKVAAFHDSNADSFHLEQYDYVIDAIDSLEDKAALILAVTALADTTLLSSMGAARKLDPQRIQTSEFWKVHGCPLAKALRTRFKKMQRFPAKKFRCVFSDELVETNGVKGSMMHITAVFGLTLASFIIQNK